MMTNDAPALPQADHTIWRQTDALPDYTMPELWQLLQRQAALYTGMSSDSIPAKTAAELLAGIRFCQQTASAAWPAKAAAASAQGPSANAAPPHSLAQWMQEGQRILYSRQQQGKQLQKQAEDSCLPLPNFVYREVLRETQRFFTWYDIRFLPHHIPCMIDYPPALPVPDTLLGIDYICAFLQRRIWEDRFCRSFALSKVQRILARHSAEWQDLPLNLFAPVLAHALGAALARMDTVKQLGGLAALPQWARQTANGQDILRQLLKKAAGNVCNTLRLWGSAQRGYYQSCAAALAPQLWAASAEGLGNLFAATAETP